MTRVKLCGMMRPEDIQAVNKIKPEYIGFVFAKKSRRYVSKEQAKVLKEMLDPAVKAVGVFVNEPVENVADLLNEGIVAMTTISYPARLLVQQVFYSPFINLFAFSQILFSCLILG